MKLRIKSISAKASLLYIFLAIINMSFFTMMIYENQIDLITENTKYHARELTSMLISSLQNHFNELKTKKIFNLKTKEDVLGEINSIIGKTVEDYIIFTGDGKILYKSKPDSTVSKTDLLNSIKAITNKDFSGRNFYSSVNEDKYEISFYIPFNILMLEDSILFLKYKMQDIGTRLSNLYRLIIVILSIIALFHILFAIVFFRLFVRPIKSLHEKSVKISQGDLAARANIKQDDEIGRLGEAFNSMADSIQEKITSLQNHTNLINFELDIAGEVQKIIYPALKNDDRFNFAVYHKSLGKVSGDYYDIFPIGDSQYGFLIVDVSGHGVPAALITMMAKEMFKLYAPNYDNPSELLHHINAEITDILVSYDSHITLFFSAFYLIIDGSNTVSYSNAGHVPPLLVRKQKGAITKLQTDGLILGISKESHISYETKKTIIENGDKIILFTDGIIESKNSKEEPFEMDGLISSVRKSYMQSCEDVIQKTLQDLGEFTDMNKLQDDLTLFVIEVK